MEHFLDWDIEKCKAYAEQLRDKARANTAEHAAQAIEYLVTRIEERAALQPKQEQGAYIHPEIREMYEENFDKYFTMFAKKYEKVFEQIQQESKWVGLTDEEIYEAERLACIGHIRHINSTRGQQMTPADNQSWHFAQVIEQVLKRKNT